MNESSVPNACEDSFDGKVIDSIGLIKTVIHDMGIDPWYPEYLELVDIGHHAYEIATASYNKEKSRLSHWAYMKIRWYIINYYQNHKTKIKHLHNDYSLDDENVSARIKSKASVETFEDRILNKIDLDSIIETMPKRTQKILHLYYKNGYQLKEIGELLDMPQTAVYAVHKKALRKLRHRFVY